jgi:hypothetical protein
MMETPVVLEEALTSEQILKYFEGSSSPYSVMKHYKAKQETPNG